MRLVEVSLAGFQSYAVAQRLELEPDITLLVGRNNVGKSAMLRALASFGEPQQGARSDFALELTWDVPAQQVLERLRSQRHLPEIADPLEARDEHRLRVKYEPTPPPPAADQQIDATYLDATSLSLLDVGWHAEGRAGFTAGWTSGPLQGATGTHELGALARELAERVRHVAPRIIDPGRRGVRQVPRLAPDSRNLVDVVAYLQAHDPVGGFPAVVNFMRDAFPEIATISVPTDEQQGMGEVVVFFQGRNAPTPLRLCGSGVEQLLALSVGVVSASPGHIFLIDEPQAYLHPHAERALLRFIRDRNEHQYLIATHSHVLLNSQPLSAARMVSMEGGWTIITRAPAQQSMLSQLGVTAAALGLADHLLWVEGPSEEEVVRVLLASDVRAERLGLAVRRMPHGASRFAATRAKQTEAAYAFLKELSTAVLPLPLGMTFVFDLDEKDERERSRISDASRGLARFLPVRELENLFLDEDLLTSVIAERAANAAVDVPSRGAVVDRLKALVADTDNARLFPPGGPPGDPLRTVKGSAVLDALFWEFVRRPYDKVRDGRALAEHALETAPDLLQPLADILDEISRSLATSD